MAGTLFLCATAKFLLDFLRYSHVGKIVSFNQIVCLVIVVSCVIYGFVINGRRKKNGI